MHIGVPVVWSMLHERGGGWESHTKQTKAGGGLDSALQIAARGGGGGGTRQLIADNCNGKWGGMGGGGKIVHTDDCWQRRESVPDICKDGWGVRRVGRGVVVVVGGGVRGGY